MTQTLRYSRYPIYEKSTHGALGLLAGSLGEISGSQKKIARASFRRIKGEEEKGNGEKGKEGKGKKGGTRKTGVVGNPNTRGLGSLKGPPQCKKKARCAAAPPQ